MRIGIMLRHLGQHEGGVLVYTRNLLREMLALESPHEFVLMYQDPKLVGTHGNGVRVREVVIQAPSVLLWDQVAVARAARRERLDMVFNPKYSVPLFTDAATAFVCHGLDWFVAPEWSRWRDRVSHRLLMPRYARKASAIIAVSDTARRDAVRFLGAREECVTRVYHGVGERFREPVSREALESVRHRYDLPDRFFLYCGQIYPPKNFGRLVQALERVGSSLDTTLVVAGSHTWLSERELKAAERLGDRVRWLGWVPRADLPGLYASAELLVLPSLYESFGLPLLEAMSVGCPVVTSERKGTQEVVDGAGLLVDPEDVESIAEGMRRVVEDRELRERLVAAGRHRAREFTWTRCARETLRVLERADS